MRRRLLAYCTFQTRRCPLFRGGVQPCNPSAVPRNILPSPAGTPVIMHLDIWIHTRRPQQSQVPGLAEEEYNSPTLLGYKVPSWGPEEAYSEGQGQYDHLSSPLTGTPGGSALLLGDLEHAEALVLLQQLALGPDLLPEAMQLLLLLLGAQVDAGHGTDDLPHLLELGLQGVQVLVDVWAVLVHAFDDVVNQR